MCREETADVDALQQILGRVEGLTIRASDPTRIDVQMEPGRIIFRLDGKPFQPALVLGWTSLHHGERGRWLLWAFEMAGIKVLNGAQALAFGQNKFLASVRMSLTGIPHIPTWLVGSTRQLEMASDALRFPLVIKPVHGAKGDGVRLVSDMVTLQHACALYFSRNLPVYLQQQVMKPGRDIRVRVIDYVADIAFYRYVAEDGFLTNLSQGGEFRPVKIDEQMRDLAERSARVMQAPIAGVDICEDETGAYHVIEVNMTPAFTWPYEQSAQKVGQLILGALDHFKSDMQTPLP